MTLALKRRAGNPGAGVSCSGTATWEPHLVRHPSRSGLERTSHPFWHVEGLREAKRAGQWQLPSGQLYRNGRTWVFRDSIYCPSRGHHGEYSHLELLRPGARRAPQM